MEVTLASWVNEVLTGVPRRSCEPMLARPFCWSSLAKQRSLSLLHTHRRRIGTARPCLFPDYSDGFTARPRAGIWNAAAPGIRIGVGVAWPLILAVRIGIQLT